MKKTYQMFLALMALMLFGAVNAGAQERIPFDAEHFTFHNYTGWDADAVENGVFEGAFILGQAEGCPIGDTSCNAWVDLTGYSKLYVEMIGCDKDGVENGSNPRIFINRMVENGQFSSDKNSSNCLVIPNSGTWATDYYTQEGNTYIIDLKKIATDWGFVHFHSIKGSAWDTKAIVNSITVEKPAKAVGWINILTNSDMEGDDTSSFVTVINGSSSDGGVTYPAVIEDGVGVNNSRGLALRSMENAPETWSTQLFVKLPEILPIGTQWRFSMDVISNPDANVNVAGHAAPRSWQCGGGDVSSDFANGFTSTSEWKTITAKGTINENLFGKGFQSIAFDLNNDKTTATQYYFDNIKFEIYKYGTAAEFVDDNIKVDFGFETNIPELCKAAGKNRVMFPVENAQVLVNNKEVEITSVEGFADGRFYIFLEETASEGDKVRVIYNNAAGDLQLKYAAGPNAGQVVGKVDEIADYNASIASDYDDVYPYVMFAPTVVAAVPEQGSFNIKNDLKEFYVKFDKKADASKIVAKLDGKALTVRPNEGLAEEFTLVYAGDNLKDGLHTINITKIYPEAILSDEIFTDTTYQFSVGAPDPNDVPVELIPLSYFNSCANGSVPEGFRLFADNMEERVAGGSYSGGARLFNDFAAGGDFTSALYMRTNYLTYGFNDDQHKLTMEADKTYTLTFNAARWKASGEFLKVLFLDAAGNELLSQTVTCNPDVNGSKNAVKGSSAYSINFTPVDAGDYELRFVVANNADGEDAGETWHELLLANVKLAYIPNSFGVVETIAVAEALEKAKKTQTDNADERYDGAAQTALNDAIAKVEAEKDGYTSPSECYGAIELLNTCSAALIDHAALCNNYDKLIKDGSDVVRQHASDKFAALPLYAQLVELVNKYHGVSVMQNDGTEEEPNWQKHYTYDILKDDAALTAAVTELTDIVNTTAKLFTTGQSKRNTTGVAALVERLRLGAETLKTLGKAEDSYPVSQALNALEDDDVLAEEVKNYVKTEVYGQLKDPANTLFEGTFDDEGNVITKSYDMTVFVKNPNLYALEYSTEIPGWTNVSGTPGAWSDWDGNKSHNSKTPYVEDCCLYMGWHASCMTEQTITDLPAGVYTIQFSANDNSGESDGTCVYVKKSDTPAVEDGAELNPDVNFAAYAQVDNAGWDRAIEGVVVTDGYLTLGFKSGTVSQPFLEEVHVLMTGPAEGYNYVLAYESAAAGIETLEGTPAAKVRAIELYDVNGRRIAKAQKGLVIMKQVMSDGSIRTIKVVK